MITNRMPQPSRIADIERTAVSGAMATPGKVRKRIGVSAASTPPRMSVSANRMPRGLWNCTWRKPSRHRKTNTALLTKAPNVEEKCAETMASGIAKRISCTRSAAAMATASAVDAMSRVVSMCHPVHRVIASRRRRRSTRRVTNPETIPARAMYTHADAGNRNRDGSFMRSIIPAGASPRAQ